VYVDGDRGEVASEANPVTSSSKRVTGYLIEESRDLSFHVASVVRRVLRQRSIVIVTYLDLILLIRAMTWL
jgi:hypothetical protein